MAGKQKRKLKKLAKVAGKAALIGGALYGATRLGKRRKSAADAAATEEIKFAPGRQIEDVHPALRGNRYKFDTDYITGNVMAKGGRAGKKDGGRTGKQFGGGLNRPVARPIGGAGAPVRPLAYKHGGKVKSMGIAKRGGGIAKR